jgi:hypothetical protein
VLSSAVTTSGIENWNCEKTTQKAVISSAARSSDLWVTISRNTGRASPEEAADAGGGAVGAVNSRSAA